MYVQSEVCAMRILPPFSSNAMLLRPMLSQFKIFHFCSYFGFLIEKMAIFDGELTKKVEQFGPCRPPLCIVCCDSSAQLVLLFLIQNIGYATLYNFKAVFLFTHFKIMILKLFFFPWKSIENLSLEFSIFFMFFGFSSYLGNVNGGNSTELKSWGPIRSIRRKSCFSPSK